MNGATTTFVAESDGRGWLCKIPQDHVDLHLETAVVYFGFTGGREGQCGGSPF